MSEVIAKCDACMILLLFRSRNHDSVGEEALSEDRGQQEWNGKDNLPTGGGRIAPDGRTVQQAADPWQPVCVLRRCGQCGTRDGVWTGTELRRRRAALPLHHRHQRCWRRFTFPTAVEIFNLSNLLIVWTCKLLYAI